MESHRKYLATSRLLVSFSWASVCRPVGTPFIICYFYLLLFMFLRFDLMYYLLFNIFIYASVMTFIMFFFASFAYGIPN